MSNIQIEILNVTPNKVPSKTGYYTSLEVAFKNLTFQGKVEGKKIMDFAEKIAFNALVNASPGSKWDVTRVKGEKYWTWEAVSPLNSNATTQGIPMAEVTKVTKSQYETAEERAARQVMIVRQSSLSNAIALATAIGDKKATIESIIKDAMTFEAFVLGKDKPTIENLQDDDPI